MRWRLAVPAAILAIAAAVVALLVSDARAAPTVTTDKADYFSGEIVTITGSGYAPGEALDVPVIRPDGSIVKGNGSFISGWDTVIADSSGAFVYFYQLDGIAGTYTVKVFHSPWGGPGSGDALLASTTFTDADIHFSQCRNDADNNNVPNGCEW